MKNPSRSSWVARPRMRAAAIAALLVGIFVFDTGTNLEIAGAVFYVVVILLAIGLLSTRGVVALAAFCVLLTLVSFALTPSGARGAGLANSAISIAAIGITAYLGVKRAAAEAAAYEARSQLVRMARMTNLGAFTASIAHEVNQPLAAVVTSANASLRWLDQDPPNLDRARRSVDRIIADANRASAVIARLRGLARREPPRRERINLNEVIAEAVTLARQELGRNGISLQLDLATDVPPVLADRIQMQQVLGNLLLNAIEAMEAVPVARRGLEVRSFQEGSGRVAFAVEDSGVGLPAEMQAHLFEAFWTTKPGGMGMGLAICQSIVESHGGHIAAAPRLRGGAVFQVSLPAEEVRHERA
ncbi:MAG TPA: ATP-binding protein [Phenylobacterium sp.]|uniref:sensor histidine kinase n=1 Tax=Phenylobacterium sp. TaxID=1871053 RepID=UPI002B4992CB|nr:ATP-binding protein [Phenylobacterium sp.]HKR88815.1 ATP-binding protein [Phenylobacterium sp.]